jgi:hypothetical protein
VQLQCQVVDPLGELGVGLEQLLLRDEVVVGLGLLERRLAVLADHHERRQEDRLERDDQRQRLPRAFLEKQHPHREQRDVHVDEGHRPGERRDAGGDLELEVVGSLLQRMLNYRVVHRRLVLGRRLGLVGERHAPSQPQRGRTTAEARAPQLSRTCGGTDAAACR